MIGEVNTKSSKRTISLPDATVQALKHQRKQQLEERLAAGDSWNNKHSLVFANLSGGPLRRTNVLQRDLYPICKKAVLENVTLHTFRHTHASLLTFEGIDIKTISRRLGHASIDITLQTYAHILPGQDERAADAMNEIMDQLGGRA